MTRRITVVKPSEMFRLMNDNLTLGDSTFSSLIENKSSLRINIENMSDKFVVTAVVPGYKKDEISISFRDNELLLEAQKEEQNESSDSEIILREYSIESLKRRITLPEKVDVENAEAELNDGIMTITVPKMPEILPKKISIK